VILTPRFCFIHIPRTGGTWARQVLRAACPDLIVEWPGNYPLHEVQRVYGPQPCVLSLRRDPAAWHVSYWAFHAALPDAAYFPPQALSPGQWPYALFARPGVRGSFAAYWDAVRRLEPRGLYTQTIHGYLGDRPVRWIDLDQAAAQLTARLVELGYAPPATLPPPANTSRHPAVAACFHAARLAELRAYEPVCQSGIGTSPAPRRGTSAEAVTNPHTLSFARG
jgi:hypothetical protein